MKNTVSVITPAYNSEKYIKEAVESVASQTISVYEHIIVDDGSTDDTLKILKELSKKYKNIKILTQANQGAGIARNKGIQESSGRYIAFLDSDDKWYPTKIAKQLEVFDLQSPAIVFSSYDVIREPTKKRVRTVTAAPVLHFKNMLITDPIGCLTAVYDTRQVGKIFMPELRQRQDWGLWMRVLKRYDMAIGISESLAVLRLRSDSLTANKFRATYYSWRLLREEAGLSRFRTLMSVLLNLFFALKRRVS